MKFNIPNFEYMIAKKVVSMLRESSDPNQMCTIEELKCIIAQPLPYLHHLTMVEKLTGNLRTQDVLRALEESGFSINGDQCGVDEMSKFNAALAWGQGQLDYWHERMEKGFH